MTKRIYNTRIGEIQLDLTKQKFAIELDEFSSGFFFDDMDDTALKELYNSHQEPTFEERLIPSLADYPGKIHHGSLGLFASKCKQVDDAIYAKVEQLLQNGCDSFVGKQSLIKSLILSLKDLLKAMPDEKNATLESAALLTAASELGGVAGHYATTSDLDNRKISVKAKKLKKEFLENEFKSKPIGFYSTNEELRQIFLQDRLLQTKTRVTRIKKAIKSSPENETAYLKLLSLVEKLTNPFVGHHVLDAEEEGMFLPPSRAHETEIIKELFGSNPIPDNFVLMDEMIVRIKDGRLKLEPQSNSGWYDRQIYALEPCLTPENHPEASKIEWGEKYLSYLEDMFVSLFAATRETHIKQLEAVRAGCAAYSMSIDLSPKLSVEPLPEYYLRRANSYLFIRNVLTEFFGEHELLKAGLLKKILDIESLLFGAYQLCCDELGLESKLDDISKRELMLSKVSCQDWLQNIKTDPDIGKDVRALVPLFFDVERQKTKVLAILGYQTTKARIKYINKPEATVLNEGKDITSQVKINWHGQSMDLFKLETAELYVDKIMNREEFRSLCDQHKTKSAIIDAIKGG